MYQVIISSQPLEQWRFETVRVGYQDLLKQAHDHLDLEEVLRTRLNRLTQYEQAAKAARAIESILARSHRRDSEVATVRKDLAPLERAALATLTPLALFSRPPARLTATRSLP